jgi:hypothetical protein
MFSTNSEHQPIVISLDKTLSAQFLYLNNKNLSYPIILNSMAAVAYLKAFLVPAESCSF